jgi:hypothetical protein
MTTESQGRVFSSHKPHFHVSCTLLNPLVQENTVSEHEMFPEKFKNLFILNDSIISPDTTGLSNGAEMKRQGSSVTINRKIYNSKKLFTRIRENLFNTNREAVL